MDLLKGLEPLKKYFTEEQSKVWATLDRSVRKLTLLYDLKDKSYTPEEIERMLDYQVRSVPRQPRGRNQLRQHI